MNETKIPETWSFDHDAKTIPAIMGISDERSDEIVKAGKIGFIKGDTKPQIIEEALNEAKPTNINEVIFCVFCATAAIKDNSAPTLLRQMFEELQKE